MMTSFDKVVIDGDQLIYACGFAATGEPLSHVLSLIKKALHRILEDVGTDNYELFIAGSGNFRDDLAWDYKANRTSEKPEFYEESRQYMVDTWNAERVDGMEADDVVSVKLWEDFVDHGGDKERCRLVLSSPDKDLKNTPGWHYNPRTRETTWISTKQADRHFYYQLLAGDTVDNIKGLPYCTPDIVEEFSLHWSAKKGCGDKAAKKIISETEYGSELQTCKACYLAWGEAEGMEEQEVLDYMLEQGRLLWMTREFDEFDAPVMWEMNENGYVR